MLAKIFAVIFMSLSMRSAKIQPNPVDCEILGGFEGQYAVMKAKYERENGDYYRGVYLKTKPYKTEESEALNPLSPKFLENTYIELNINEAKNINKQYVYKTLFSWKDIFSIRKASEWTEWQDYRFMMGLEIDLSNTLLIEAFLPGATTIYQYDTNLSDRHISRLTLSMKINNGKFYVMPSYVIESYDNDSSWQLKTEVGIQL